MKYNISKKDKYELLYHYEIRKKFINFLQPKSKKELLYHENLSNILINIIFLKCKYDMNTHKLIFEILKKINDKNLLKLLPKNYDDYNVNELKKSLKKKKLSTYGKKADLIKRLNNS